MTQLARVAKELCDAQAGPTATHAALHRALRLEKEAPIDAVLSAVLSDVTTQRLAAYRRSVVLEPAQFEEPADEPAPRPEPAPAR